MNWNLDKNKPICPQICEQFCVCIASGELNAGDRLPSVRDLAVEVGVNPNTVQRSFETLENEGIIYTVRNSGRFVGEDTEKAKQTVERIRMEKTKEYFDAMTVLGMNEKTIKSYVEEWNK